MTGWGRRKDNKQSYPKNNPKGVAGAGTQTSPTSDVHLKIPQNLERLMNLEHDRNLVMDFSGTTWFDLERDLTKLSHNDKVRALELLQENKHRVQKVLDRLKDLSHPDPFEKAAIENFDREIKITVDGIKQLKKLLNIKDSD